jgi:hypothetical protein
MILKIGSRGKEVKSLQEYLGLYEDGDFGPNTEKLVKEWQLKNGLSADGIVGPKTWDSMGIATTDNSESIYVTSNDLSIERYYLPKGEYNNGPTKKEYLFLHHTSGWHNPYKCIDQWGRDDRGKIATEFVLGGPSVKGNDDSCEGKLLQSFPEGGYGWHLGKNGSQSMHTNSVGIEVCNFGDVVNGKTYAGTRVDESQIVKLDKPFRGYQEWHKYSNEQIETLRKFIIHIAERDNIDVRDGLISNIKLKGVDGFEFNEDAYYGNVKGMWTHTNVRKDKTDLFPQQELIDMLLSI